MARYEDFQLNNGQYIQQYQGLPLDEIRRTSDVLSERHYQNLANLNQLQLLREQYKSKVPEGARSYFDTQFQDIDSALRDIAKQGGENATAKVAAISNRFLGDQGVLKSMQRAEEIQKEIEIENELLAKGLQPLRKKGLREAAMQAPVIDPETGELHSVYSSPYRSTVTQYEDPIPHMENIWKTINRDSIESALKAAPGTTIKELLGESMAEGMPDVPLFFESLTKAGISSDKITQQLGNAWNSYQQTPAYKQAIEYADDPATEEARQKDQFYKHGLLRTYNEISRQYSGNQIADDLIRRSGQAATGAFPTQAPGQPIETLFNYNENGHTKEVKLSGQNAYSVGGLDYSKKVEGDSGKEYDPQYISDYKTMLEIKGQNSDIAPDSPEAKQAVKEYKALVEQRVSNPFVLPFDKKTIDRKNDELHAQLELYKFMDPISGETFSAFGKDGQLTDEFKEYAGEDLSKIKSTLSVSSEYDAKNHYNINPGGDKDFAKPLALISQNADGTVKRLLASQLPSQTNPIDINTNKIYTTVNMRPGQWQDVSPRVKARELHGAQLQEAGLTEEDLQAVSMPIEATVDGQTYLFDSPEHLSRYLLTRGIQLDIK